MGGIEREPNKPKRNFVQISIPDAELDKLKQDARSCDLPMNSVIRQALHCQRLYAYLAAQGWQLIPPGAEHDQAMPLELVSPINAVFGGLIDHKRREIQEKKTQTQQTS